MQLIGTRELTKAGISKSRLYWALEHGRIPAPVSTADLYLWTVEQAEEIKAYFATHKPWQSNTSGENTRS
jgi:hypothetical protein